MNIISSTFKELINLATVEPFKTINSSRTPLTIFKKSMAWKRRCCVDNLVIAVMIMMVTYVALVAGTVTADNLMINENKSLLRGRQNERSGLVTKATITAPTVSRKLDDEAEGDNNNNENNEEEEQEEEAEEEEEQEEEQGEEDKEEEQEDQNRNGSEDEANNENNDAAGEGYFDELVSNMKNRFESDVASMWKTSPSEWDGEIWKDFGIFLGIVAGLMTLFCLCCCLCCRGGDNNGKGLSAMTESEAKARRHNRGRFFFRRNRSDDSGGFDTDATVDDHTSPFVLIEDVDKTNSFITHDTKSMGAGTGISTGGIGTSKTDEKGIAYCTLSPLSTHTKTNCVNERTTVSNTNGEDALGKRSSVIPEPSKGIVGETVDVWSEFLGLKKAKYNIKSKYAIADDETSGIDTTDDEQQIDQRKKSSSSRRGWKSLSRSSSPRKKKPSISVNSSINDQNTAGSDRTNTSEKLNGSIHSKNNGGANASESGVTSNNPSSAAAAAVAAVDDQTAAAADGTIVSSATTNTNGTLNYINSNSSKMSSFSGTGHQETSVMGNSTSKSTKSPKNSSRKNFLKGKSKNLLQSFGRSGSKNKNSINTATSTSSNKDTKKEALLTTEEGGSASV